MTQNSRPEMAAPGNAAELPELERSLEITSRMVAELVGRPGQKLRALRVHSSACSVEIEWADDDRVPDSVLAPSRAPDVVVEASTPREFLCAPAVGVFYEAPSPGAEPFVKVGDLLMPGQQVAIVEAMKMTIPIEADRPGRVLAVIAENGKPVEYGSPLYELALVSG